MAVDEFFETLSKGSEYHRAKRTANSLTLMPILDRDPTREHFKAIVGEAISRADAIGCDVTIHESDTDSYGMDSVTISFVE
jgi:hypothetical protein